MSNPTATAFAIKGPTTTRSTLPAGGTKPKTPSKVSSTPQSQHHGHARMWLTAAAVASSGAVLARRQQRRWRSGRGLGPTGRRVWEIALELPLPSAAELQQAAEAFAGSLPVDLAEATTAAAKAIPAPPTLPTLAAPEVPSFAAPEVPPELAAAAAQVQEALRMAVEKGEAPDIEKLAKDLHLDLSAAGPAGPPAAAGLLLVALLALRRGKQAWMEELPRVYNGPWIEAYWQRRPLRLFQRFMEVAIKFGAFSTSVELDKYFGREEEMQPQRAAEARELITDLGPAFVKIVQVWASRPDILPEAYLKECEKLLEQVRPFGKEEALETLSRNIEGDGAVEKTFGGLSAFDKPVAAASVGQVYRAKYEGRDVAVKVQRPDVREQVTLDIFVIRRLSSLGSYLPIERYAAQFRSLFELIDRTAPPFVEELDYELEAANQRRFAKTIEDCELVADTVVVPEVLFASREVLVQEWLEGKKLTEPGAAQDQAERVVKVLLNSYMVQFLETGFLHGDPHPGNFVLMPSGKLGILDYGLMTEVSAERRVAFIEYLMHLQAKMYDECLEDLINLGFLPAGLADDTEAREVIVPGLASTLSILYEGSGDLREQREKFQKQREELQKEPGKLEKLREQLQAIAKKYGSFRLPGYMTLILRAFVTLEGVGLKVDGGFSIIKECFPYVARRLLTDDSLRMREALRAYLYKGRTRIAASRIDDIATGFSSFTNVMKGSTSEAVRAGAPVPEAALSAPAASGSTGSTPQASTVAAEVREEDDAEVDTAAKDIAKVLFSPDGNFLQELLIEEGTAAIDALSRAALLQLLRGLGPLAAPLEAPLGLLLGVGLGGPVEGRLVTREDKEALLLIRKITRIIQAPQSEQAEVTPQTGTPRTSGSIFQTVQDLQRLQPLAASLAPTVAPGARAFAERFVRTLASRALLRVAEDLERGAGGFRIPRPSELTESVTA